MLAITTGPPRLLRLVALSLLLLSVLYFSLHSAPLPHLPSPSSASVSRLYPWKSSHQQLEPPSVVYDPADPCSAYEGIEDVYAILKTGASVAADKLPVHFNTTLRCVPDFVIFSDHDENVAGHRVADSLDDIDPEVVEHNVDFDTYRRLRAQGKGSLSSDEGGFKDSAGWKLDKWKFLPMLDKAFRARPAARWFVFFEDDTFVSWPNMLKYLAQLDPRQPLYAGAQMWIGDRVFAHGGSGFVLSNEAMRLAVEGRRADVARWDAFTATEWAGDCVLGALMADVGAGLFGAWPNFQGENPNTIDFPTDAADDRYLWCQPVLTHHHVAPADIARLWALEQRWLADSAGGPIYYRDILADVVLPAIRARAPLAHAWDNLADQETAGGEPAPGSDAVAACRALCEAQSDCVQFRVRSDADAAAPVCQWSRKVQLGAPVPPDGARVESGWLLDRIEAFADRAGRCHGPEWKLPDELERRGELYV